MLERLLARFTRLRDVTTPELTAWRLRAEAAVRDGSSDEVRSVIDERRALNLTDEDTEMECERLQARIDVLTLEARLAAGDLPRVETQHKAIGSQACAFIAPAVLCAGDGDQPGKLFLTSAGIRFIGGAGVTLRWSAVREVTTSGRDLLVVSQAGGGPRCFRCNSFSDVWQAALIVEHLRRGQTATASRSSPLG